MDKIIHSIAYVMHSTHPQGGSTKSLLNLLEGISRQTTTIYVIVPDEKGIYQELKQKGYQTIAINYRSNTYPWTGGLLNALLFIPRLMGRRWLNWKGSRQLYRLLKNKGISLIHTNSSDTDIGYRVAKKLHIPHIYHLREYGDLDFNMHYYPSKKVFKKQLEKSHSYTICITKDIQKHHRQDNKDTSIVIYNGVKSSSYEANISEKKKYFLFAGRLEESKGLEELLDAYALYHRHTQQPKKLLIAGRSLKKSYINMLQERCRHLGITNKVSFLGPRNDIDKLMTEAIALVVTSRFEAFGRSMAEAMFNKTIVIGKNTGGTKEQFDNGKAIAGQEIGFRYNSIEELAYDMEKVCSLPKKEYDIYIHRALLTVRKLYNIEHNIVATSQFYQYILNKEKYQ